MEYCSLSIVTESCDGVDTGT